MVLSGRTRPWDRLPSPSPFHPKQRMRGAAELGRHWTVLGTLMRVVTIPEVRTSLGKLPLQPFPSWLPSAPWDSLNLLQEPGSICLQLLSFRTAVSTEWLCGGQWVEAKVGHWQPKDTLGKKALRLSHNGGRVHWAEYGPCAGS